VKNVTLVSGTGRCGTTFLMKLFTCLKLNTGITKEQIKKNIYQNCNSGIELNIEKTNAYIYKNPTYARTLNDIVKKNIIVDFLIVPVRDYKISADSRGKFGLKKNGGFCWNAKNVESQINEYYKSISILLLDITKLNISTIFLDYDKMICDKEYLYQKLLPLFSKFNIDYDSFCKEFDDEIVQNIVQK
jgi:hypothetical protein